jgi:hypothetical protein
MLCLTPCAVRSVTVFEKKVMNSCTGPFWKKLKDDKSDADARTVDASPGGALSTAIEKSFILFIGSTAAVT